MMNEVIFPFFLCLDALQLVQRIASILGFEQGLGRAMVMSTRVLHDVPSMHSLVGDLNHTLGRFAKNRYFLSKISDLP